MNVLNIEVIDMYVERFSKENYLEVCLTTTNGAYIAKVSILGVFQPCFLQCYHYLLCLCREGTEHVTEALAWIFCV